MFPPTREFAMVISDKMLSFQSDGNKISVDGNKMSVIY